MGRLGPGLVSCFWKQGDPGGFQEALKAWNNSGLMPGDCGTFHLGHNLRFPIHKALTHRIVVRIA